MQTVTITRQTDDGKETTGILTVGNFTCKTLERPWLNNQHMISCIPKGTYIAVWAYQGDLKEWHYTLQNVLDRDGIFMHEFNYVFQSEGCIGLGKSFVDMNGDKEPDITYSRVTINSFETLMNKQSFTLIIQ